jgi:Protein of unknown function, DUF488.
MKIYTGYYAKLPLYESNGLIGISIAGKAPAFWETSDRLQYKKLAPKYWFFQKYKSGEYKEHDYRIAYYKEVLNTLKAKNVFNELAKLSYNSDKIILLCYEKPGDFCHRRIVADWLETELDIKVPEFKIKS